MRAIDYSGFLAVLFLAVASAGPAVPNGAAPVDQAADDPFAPQWTTERLGWSGEIAFGEALEIVNEFGDLRLRPSSGRAVEVSAVAQRRFDVEAETEIAVSRTDRGLQVAVRFPDESIPAELVAPGGHLDRRVDVVAFVPTDVAITARTVFGLLEAKGLEARSELATRSGDILVRTTAPLEARSERGSIDVALGAARWTDPVRLETTTGDIRLELAPGTDADARISTRAVITTDYSIAIERQGLLRRAVATIGAGGSAIEIDTVKGRVSLLEGLGVD